MPTDGPESDGTLEWTSTTIVIVEVEAGGKTGLGYTYAHRATAVLIADALLPIVKGADAMDVAANWIAMVRAIRNQGRPGIASMAIAAVDVAPVGSQSTRVERATRDAAGRRPRNRAGGRIVGLLGSAGRPLVGVLESNTSCERP